MRRSSARNYHRQRTQIHVLFLYHLPYKTYLEGNILASAQGLAGHLGYIAYNYDDGRVYGSLEFKRDSMGKGSIDYALIAKELNDCRCKGFLTLEVGYFDSYGENDGKRVPAQGARRSYEISSYCEE